MKHAKDIARFIDRGDYQETKEGLLIHGSLRARGKYTHWVNDREDVRVDYNLIPTEGIAHVLNVVWGATAKVSTWYIAMIGGNVTPAATWTAANFATNATEVTSTTEGYSQSTRPVWTPGTVTSGVLDNVASPATFSIVCTSTLTFYGLALLSSNVRGGTSGVLGSACRLDVARTLSNGDQYKAEYEVELTDS